MIGNNYGIMLVDSSFLLTRNLWMATKDKSPEEMNPGDVLRLNIQTIHKVARDYGIKYDKVIFIADKWDSNIKGYYRKDMIKDFVEYKGTRKWMSAQLLEEMKNDPNVTPEQIYKAECELAQNRIKFKVKEIMEQEFPKFGIPYISWPGYEFDDIATLASFQLYGRSSKPNVILTKDSDLSYSLSPGSCVQFKLPTRGSKPEIITYEQMYETIPEVLRKRGMQLYQYFSYINSLGFSHNDTLRTIKKGADPTVTILQILDGDYSNVEKVDAFKAQMKSFDLNYFPDLDKVRNLVESFDKVGHLGNLLEFKDFCSKYNINGISDNYYTEFISRLDPDLYKD